MKNTNQSVEQIMYQQLQDLGIVQGNNEYIQNQLEKINDDTPWFINLFLGICGFLSGLLLFGFIGLSLSFVLEKMLSQIILMLLSFIGSFILSKNNINNHNAFLDSLAVSISIVGQFFLVYFLFSFFGDKSYFGIVSLPIVWSFMFAQLVLLIIMPNFLQRCVSGFLALGCLLYLLYKYEVFYLSLGVVAFVAIISILNRDTFLKWASKLSVNKLSDNRPSHSNLSIFSTQQFFELGKVVMYASGIQLALSPLYMMMVYNDFYGLTGIEPKPIFNFQDMMAQGFLVIVSIYAIQLILKRYDVSLLSKTGVIITLAVILLGILSIDVTGLLTASLIIVMAMANSQGGLMGLGIFSLFSYVFWYYYQLDSSLLIKSISLLVVGLVLLAIRWGLVKRYFANIQTSYSHDLSSDNSENIK